jgi:site-specific DNA-adenine methylase
MIRIGQPLKWPGGKGGGTQARDLLACRPAHFDQFREPFCGGSLIWQPNLLPPGTPRWINDREQPLINFYKQLKSDSTFIDRFQKLRTRILGHADRTIAAFEAAKDDFVTNGVSYLLLRRLAVRQIVKESRPNIASISFDYLADYRGSLHPITRQKLEAWRRILKGVRITNLDYSKVLAYPIERGKCCFSLLDPPYWRRSSTTGDHDLRELLDVIAEAHAVVPKDVAVIPEFLDDLL